MELPSEKYIFKCHWYSDYITPLNNNYFNVVEEHKILPNNINYNGYDEYLRYLKVNNNNNQCIYFLNSLNKIECEKVINFILYEYIIHYYINDKFHQEINYKRLYIQFNDEYIANNYTQIQDQLFDYCKLLYIYENYVKVIFNDNNYKIIDMFRCVISTAKTKPLENNNNTINNNNNIMTNNLQLYDLSDFKIPYLKCHLYNFQMQNVKWMLNVEENNYQFVYNLDDYTNEIEKYNANYNTALYPFGPFILLGKLNGDKLNNAFYKKKKFTKIKYKGGCLMDDVGLGKTIQILSLIVSSPCKMFSKIEEMGHKKLLNIFEKSCNETNHTYYSKATLIIVPNLICKQWYNEIQDKFDTNKLKIIKIFTKTDYKKLSEIDIIDADIILCSFNFIAKYPFLNAFYYHRLVVDEIHEIFLYKYDILKEYNANYKWAVSATPFTNEVNYNKLCHYLNDYNRNISSIGIFKYRLPEMDFVLENLTRKNIKKNINEYTFSNITETIYYIEFTNVEKLIYATHLSNVNENKFSTLTRKLCCYPQLDKEILMNIQNTKNMDELKALMVDHYRNIILNYLNIVNDSIYKIFQCMYSKNEYILGICKHYLITNENKDSNEYEIYTDMLNILNNDELLLENNPLMVETVIKQFIDVRKYITTNDIGNMNNQLNYDIISNYYEKHNEILSYLNKLNNNEMYTSITTKLLSYKLKTYNNLKEAFDNNIIILNSHISKFNYYNYVFNTINKILNNSLTDTCGICYSDFDTTNISVTKCGHIFCSDCLQSAYNMNHKCPLCRINLTINCLYNINIKPQILQNDEMSEKDKLIYTLGAKLGNLIFYIKNCNEKMIIFSQWNDLLIKIDETLKQNNIETLFCTGTIYQKNKIIEKYKTSKDINIIMLSSENSASGLNLTEARKIIFIEPIYGNIKYRKDMESQAIGRAHRIGNTNNIEIIRFIIKDSVEEDIYKMNLEYDKSIENDISIS